MKDEELKDMPVVTVEQIARFRAAALEQNARDAAMIAMLRDLLNRLEYSELAHGGEFVKRYPSEAEVNEALSATQSAADSYDARVKEDVLEDARRYQRLRIIGVAPYETKHLSNRTVLRFQNLDTYCDEEIEAHPSMGEYELRAKGGETK